MTSDWATAWDTLAEAIGKSEGKSTATISDTEKLTVDQHIEVAKVAAILAVAQEINAIRHAGINPEYIADID